MGDDLLILLVTAASVGFVHTLLGPDHYLPFVVLSRARGWTLRKTLGVTLFCGLGHVLSSIVLGGLGIALGVGVTRLEAIETERGDLAAWLLISVGLVYLAWGLHRATRLPVGHDGHGHDHHHGSKPGLLALAATPWSLFIVFVLGPCEPLIPVLMYPAATANAASVVLVALVFALATLLTMAGVVTLGVRGLDVLPLGGLERYSHAMAGAAILLCGVGIRFLGL